MSHSWGNSAPHRKEQMDFFPEICSLAEETEKVLNDHLGFTMEGAHIYTITYGMTDSDVSVATSLESVGADVYDLLYSDETLDKVKSAHYIALATTGWAAPLNPQGEVEGAPSEHPQKRRVRLVVIASREEMASVLRFQDKPDETVIDHGNATGTLADAVRELLVRAGDNR